MLVQRWQDIEEYNLGSILGKPELGVKVKRITNNVIRGKLTKYNFDIEHYSVEPGKSYTMSHNKHAMVIYVMAGDALFSNEKIKMRVNNGDIVYIKHKELNQIDNTSSEPLEILCCIDRQN